MSQLCRFQPLTYPFSILCHVFAVIVERRRFARVYSAGNTFGLLLFALGRCPRVSLGPLNEETGRFVELFHNLRSCGGDGAGRERERERIHRVWRRKQEVRKEEEEPEKEASA